MKKRFFKAISIILSFLSASLLLVGCKKETENGADCRLDGKDIYFISDSEAEKWRAPLEILLSNEQEPFTVGDEVAYGAPDPSLPSISYGYAFGLFDVDLNGVPELLVDLGGGSSRNAYYEIYDIYTGDLLGAIGGGHSGSWCIYYSKDNGKYNIFGQYWLRAGFNCGSTHVSRLAYYEDKAEYGEKSYLYMSYDSYMHMVEAENGDTLAEEYSQVEYCINGRSVGFEEYAAEKDFFEQNYIRISESELSLYSWRDVCDGSESREERGKRMADALLSSGQKFIRVAEN